MPDPCSLPDYRALVTAIHEAVNGGEGDPADLPGDIGFALRRAADVAEVLRRRGYDDSTPAFTVETIIGDLLRARVAELEQPRPEPPASLAAATEAIEAVRQRISVHETERLSVDVLLVAACAELEDALTLVRDAEHIETHNTPETL